MKTRLGLLVLVAVLAGCSGQDNDTKSAQQVADSAPGTQANAISGIARFAKDSKRSLGAAPDRGELFTYRTGATTLHEGAYTLRPVSLSEEHAIRAAVVGVMAIPGPDGKDIKIAYERHEEHPDGNWSWIGRVIGGDQAQEAIFTFGQDAVFGSIPQANGPSLKLTTQRGIAYLMQADASRLFRGHRAGNDVKVAAYRPNVGGDSADGFVEMAMAKARATSSADVFPKAFTAANTIDLVAGYSNGLAARLGSDGAAVTRLNQLVAAGNQALLNSKVNARIRLVGAVKVNYADNTDNGDALDQLTGSDGKNAVAVPAALAPLRAARETTGADLVTLVRDFQSTNNGCGIAWLLGANGEAIVPGADAPFGYSIISDGDYDLNGNTYFCEDVTLVHELAHNMGSAHDVGNAGGTPGRFPYSYGYKTTAAAGNFFTVMAYGDDNQTLYRVFSNPAITTCGTRACGVANAADNARSLTQTIPIVSTFRATVVPLEGPIVIRSSGDFDNDGKDDLLWRNSITGALVMWKGAIPGQPLTTAPTPDWEMMGVGDIGGDGRSDILWRNYVTGVNTVWHSANSATSNYLTALTGAAWMPASLGDFDGNNRADLIWRNASTGANVIWKNATPGQYLTGVADQNWKVVGNGDFNGDGKSDLLWRNSVTGANILWPSASAGVALTSVTDLSWRVVGTGDFNGDGKADILWRNASTGANVIWRSAASSQAQSLYKVSDQNWQIAGLGDYNGDLRTDIMWRNLGSGQNLIWNSGNAATQRALSPVDPAWRVQP